MQCRYELTVIRTNAEFQALEPEWTRLYEGTSPRNPFLSYGWTHACWTTVCPGARLFILTARADGRLVGIAPLVLERQVGFRVVRFIADSRSDYLGFLQAVERPEVEGVLLEELARLRRHWDLAVLRQLSDTFSALMGAPIPGELRHQRIEGTVALYLSFPGDWEALCKEGPPQLRHAKRPARKFAKERGTVERITDRDVLRHVGEIIEVEARSWKVRDGVTRFQPGPGERLLRAVLGALGARGEVELWLARMEERPVAFLINLLTPERIYYYQGAYHEEYKKYYPGGVLHLHAMERAWNDGVREYDFMRGGAAYKADWTNGVRPVSYQALYPPTLRGRMAYQVLLALRWRLKGITSIQNLHQRYVRWKNNRTVAPNPQVAG
jgi:CelD/BcsL family acetyltransferase involved in cellulose biosynthesis